MSKPEIIPIFAVPIYKAKIDLPPNLKQTLLLNFERLNNGEQTRSKETCALNRLPELYKQIDFHVNQFKEQHHYEEKFKITQSWVNYTETNQSGHVHMHPNSVFSGVVYIGENLSPITFEHPRAWNQAWAFETRETNWMTSIDFSITPEHGDIILFPSYLPHRVEPSESKETRMSIAFNTFPRGAFGSEVRLNRVYNSVA